MFTERDFAPTREDRISRDGSAPEERQAATGGVRPRRAAVNVTVERAGSSPIVACSCPTDSGRLDVESSVARLDWPRVWPCDTSESIFAAGAVGEERKSRSGSSGADPGATNRSYRIQPLNRRIGWSRASPRACGLRTVAGPFRTRLRRFVHETLRSLLEGLERRASNPFDGAPWSGPDRRELSFGYDPGRRLPVGRAESPPDFPTPIPCRPVGKLATAAYVSSDADCASARTSSSHLVMVSMISMDSSINLTRYP